MSTSERSDHAASDSLWRNLLPDNRCAWVLMAIAALVPCLYWPVAMAVHPEDPLELLVCLRYGDADYLPLIKAVSQGSLHETIVYEAQGLGLLPLPIAGALLHAILLRLFGPAGFIVADVLVGCAFYLAAYALLRAVKVRSVLAAVVSVLAALSCQFDLSWLEINFELLLWDLRLVRPFVTNVFLLLCLAGLLGNLVGGVWRSRRGWAFIGVVFALLLQSSTYEAFTIAYAVPLVFVYLWVFERGRRRELCVWAAVFAIVALAASTPFLIQYATDNADLDRRCGFFPVPRFPPPWHPMGWQQFLWMVVIPTVPTVALLRWRRPDGWRSRVTVIGGTTVLSVLAYFGLPLSALFLGRTVQQYHFIFAFFAFSSYHLTLMVTCVASTLWEAYCRSRRGPSRLVLFLESPAAKRAGIVLLAVAVIVTSVNLHLTYNRKLIHRPTAKEDQHQSLQRQDLRMLMAELARRRDQGENVLATYDRTVHNLWVTFHDGFVFHPMYSYTALPDAELERRLMIAGKLLAMDRQSFLHFLFEWSTTVLWLGGAKYEVTKLHAFAPPEEYPEATQAAMRRATVYTGWTACIPMNELRRMLQQYDAVELAAEKMPRLDLLVLRKDASLEPFSPPPARFELAYENDTYRLYRRLSPAASAAE